MLRIVLGLPFVLFFPGYALICALFPSNQDLDNVERLALSVGLSLAVVPLVGLALNYTPWGIRLNPIMASLFMFTLLLSVLSNYRRSRLPAERKQSMSVPIKIFKLSAKRGLGKLLAVALLVGVVVVGGVAVYLFLAPKTGEKFTEFYLLGSNGQLADYPTNLTLGENGTVVLGVVNHEGENVTYKIVITLDNQTVDTLNNITLGNQKSWQQNYAFTPQKTGENMNLGFTLYKQGTGKPYHSLQLWINVRPQK
jgi:uncharacterized membrane protein